MSEKKISYEAARDELAEVVESLEDGSATLEESLKLWERGEELAKICQEWLDGQEEVRFCKAGGEVKNNVANFLLLTPSPPWKR